MAEELGAAVLRVTVDTRQATQALEAFRTQFSQQLGDLGKINFNGIDKGAADAGAKAGAAIRSSLQQALNNGGAVQLPQVKAPDLRNIREALDISGQLNATLADLRAYQKGLEAVRESASATDPLFKRLTATIGETRNAIRAFESGTGDLVESLARVKNTAAGLTFAPQLAALDAFRSGLKAVASTALDTTKAVAGIAAKGAVETLKVPIFGLPKDATAAIDKARAQIERLQKQAETASGKVARLTEGVATLGAGGVAAKGIVDLLGGIGDQAGTTASLLGGVADALNSLPGPLKGLGGIADIFASGTTSIQQWVSGVLQAQTELSAFTGPLQAVTDSLTALGPEAALVGGALAFTFAGFQDLINQSFKPGVEGARKALRGMTDDTQRLLEALARASEAAKGLASLRDLRLAQRDAVDRAEAAPVGSDENLQATQELVQLNKLISSEKQKQFYLEQQLTLGERERAQIAQRLRDAASPAAPLALPSSDLLQQRVLSTGSRAPQRLSPDTLNAVNNAGLDLAEQYTRQLEAGARAVKSQRDQYIAVQAEASKLLETDLRRQQILNSIARQRTGGGGFGAASAANFGATDDPVQKSIRRNREKTAAAAERALKAEERAAKATEDAARAAELRARREKALQQFRDNSAVATGRASPIDGRLGQDRFIPGSPAFREQRRRRFGEAGSNALIGGAFPLLFGQGIGASIGGAAGGGLGGFAGGQLGFGLSLLGTAVGAQFDLASQKAQTLASALNDPIGKFSELQQAALLSSKGVERQAEALIVAGREAEAAAVIQADLATTYGSLDGAKTLARQTDDLQRAWSQLGVRLAQFTSGPLAKVVEVINRALGGAPTNGETVGTSSFRQQVDTIARERGRAAAVSIVRRQILEEVNQTRRSPLQSALGTLSFGLLGQSRGARTEQANRAALDYAKAQGLITEEQKATNAALERARQLREQIYALSLQQIGADASDNKTLQDSVRLQSIQAALRERIATLQSTGKLFTQTGPNSFELSPEAVKAQQEAVTQRKALLEASKQSAAVSDRELTAARQLVGLEGDRLTIKQEQQKVDGAQRLFAQADSTFRQRFSGVDPATLVGAQRDEYQTLFNDRATAENNLTRIRLESYARIQQAEQALANERIAVERQLSAARVNLANAQQLSATPTFSTGEAGPARGAVQQVQAIRQAITQARQAAEDAARNVAQAIERGVNGEALSLLQDVAKAAGLDLRKELELGSDALRSAALQAAEALKQARLELASIVSDPQGLNQYLPAQAGQDRVEQQLQAILPYFREAQRTFEALTGYNAPEFRGDTAGVLTAVEQFIQRVDREQRAIENVQLQGRSLETINAELTTSNNNLATQIAALAAKNWSVNVNVAPNGSVSSNIGALNGTF